MKHKLCSRILQGAILFCLMCALFLSVHAEAETIYVDDDGGEGGDGTLGNPYQTFQEGYDAASDRDTIRLFGGSYEYIANVEKSLDILGNGTEQTTITGSSEGIFWFRAENSSIRHLTITGLKVGLKFGYDLNNFTVENVVTQDCTGYGMTLNGVNITITNCISQESEFTGMDLMGEHYTVSNATSNDNDDSGFRFVLKNSTISNVTAIRNGENGINWGTSFNVTMKDARIADNLLHGIMLGDGANLTLLNNTFVNDSIYISYGDYHHTHSIDSSNTVNGLPIYYLASKNNLIDYNKSGHIILANCSNIVVFDKNITDCDVGITIWQSNNCTIKNMTISHASYCGIFIGYSENITISNSTIQECQDGINLAQSLRNFIENIVIMNNQKDGIRLYNGHNNVVWNCTFTENKQGMYFSWSRENVVQFCTFENNFQGIYLHDDYNYRNEVHYSNFYDNEDHAIYAYTKNHPGRYEVEASNNWWGDPSGPYSEEENPGGKGDNISQDVHPSPYLQKAYYAPKATITHASPLVALVGTPINFTGSVSPSAVFQDSQWISNIDGLLHIGTILSFTAENLSLGDHEINFSVSDTRGVWSEPSTTYIRITERPTAEIIDIKMSLIPSGINWTFTGNGIDDGFIETYSWSSDLIGILYQGPEATFTISSLTPPFPSPGHHNISLVLQDNDGFWSDPVYVVHHFGERPSVDIITIQPDPGLEGEFITFQGVGTDDIMITNYLWISSIDGTLYRGSNTTFSLSNLSTGNHTISLVVQDLEGFWSDPHAMDLRITERPIASILQIHPNPIMEGFNVTFRGEASDDGSITNYRWNSSIDGLLYNGPEANLTLSNLTIGNHTITLTVQDNDGFWSHPVYKNLTILKMPNIVNQQPVLVILEPANGTVVTYNIIIKGQIIDELACCIENVYYWHDGGGGGEARPIETSKGNFTLFIHDHEFMPGPVTIYFRVSDGNSTSEVVQITLIIERGEGCWENEDEENTYLVPIVVIIIIASFIGVAIIRKLR